MLVAEDLGNRGGLVPTGVKTKNLKQKVVGSQFFETKQMVGGDGSEFWIENSEI